MRWLTLLAFALFGCATTAPPRAGLAPERDRAAMAETLVGELARVREGEHVLIVGEPRFAGLLTEVWLAASKRGAHALVRMGGPEMFERYFNEVPERFDSVRPGWEMELAERADVIIEIQPHHPELIKDVPADRLAAVRQALGPVEERKLERRVRQILVGNGVLPTEGMAELHGYSPAELEQVFWAGVMVDYPAMRERGLKAEKAFEQGQNVRITKPNGTDLRMEITGRPCFLADGVISDADVAEAGTGSLSFVPAGEVWCTPVPGSASGTVVFDRILFAGGEIRALSLEVADGRVVSLEAEPGAPWDAWKAQYDAAPAGKELLSWFAVGLNPGMVPPPGKELLNFVADGMLTLGLGLNTWAGGDNDVPYGAFLFLGGATLEVDGEAVVRDGLPDL